MLKSCWDCIAGSSALRNGGENDVGYGIQLNGNSERAPLRPANSGRRNMFVLPRAPNIGDEIVVSGTIRNRDRFTANLLTGSPSPDYDNIACQIEANFSDGITLQIIENGLTDVVRNWQNTNDMMTASTFEFQFTFEESYTLAIHLNKSYLDDASLKHSIGTITFLEFSGDVDINSLAFKFKN